MDKKKILMIVVVSILVTVVLLSSSYALFRVTVSGEKNYKITVGTLDFEIQNEANAIRMNNAYPMSDSEGQALNPYTFTLTNTGSLTAYYRISLIEDEEQKANCVGCSFLTTDKVKFELKEDGVVIGGPSLLSDTENVMAIGSLTNGQSKNYELRIWLTSEATTLEENKYYFGKIQVEASQEEYRIPIALSEQVFASESLGSNCATYDDGIDTFLVGQCSQNYVLYSGKLWRVVSKNNETGAVKMVTDSAITSIPFDSNGSTAFENSYVDQWLSQEFLPTLYNYSNYLVVDSLWDVTLDESDTPTRPVGTTTATRTVGLLNAYEYYTTYTNSNGLATASTGYLNNDTIWWLLTPYSSTNVRNVIVGGTIDKDTPTNAHQIRPAINLQQKVETEFGSGTIDSPYTLKGDI